MIRHKGTIVLITIVIIIAILYFINSISYNSTTNTLGISFGTSINGYNILTLPFALFIIMVIAVIFIIYAIIKG